MKRRLKFFQNKTAIPRHATPLFKMPNPKSQIQNPKSSASIRAFAFDLGQVLLEFDLRTALQNLGARCQGGETAVMSFLKENDLAQQLETGRIRARDFYAEFRRRLRFSGSYEEFCAAYSDMFRENAPMIALMRSLKQKFPVYLLSNTNEIHIRFITQRHAFMWEFHGHVYSYREGVMKPDARYFQRFLDRFCLRPAEVAFVDDLLANVEGARAIGMRAVHYQNATQAQTELLQWADELPK
jgi:putative hydrolase of the HAD superfamily